MPQPRWLYRAVSPYDRYRVRVRETARGWTPIWLVVLTLAQAAAFLLVWRFAVHTQLGQWLDTVALTGNRIGQDRIDGPVGRILNAMSVVSLLVATAMIGFIALIRGRKALAVTATLLVLGANVSTQLLKLYLVRPDFDVDPERAAAGNSLPSGHTTVAASVAIALILVLPAKVRVLGAYLGAGYAAVAAYLIVGVWAAVGGLVLLAFQRPRAEVSIQDAHRPAAALLGLGGLLALVMSGLALAWLSARSGTPAGELARRPLFIGYAGSAAGIAGTIAVVAALVLAVVHRLVPRYQG
jgi:membrane-associated phospholipid phosphatase